MSAQYCARIGGNANAATAVQCDEHLQQNGILVTEGTLDILRCYSGLGPNVAVPAQDSERSDSLELEPAMGALPKYDLALAQQNTAKRQQMVQNAISTWNPPQQLVASAAPLGVTNLSDPFAAVADSAAAPSPSSDLPASAPVVVDDSSASDEWSYPVTNDAQIDAGPDPDIAPTDSGNTPNAGSEQSWSNAVAELIKEGISESGEVGATVVASVDNAEAWAKFSSSDPSNQIEGAIGIAQDVNSQFNTNPISRWISGNTLSIVGAVGDKIVNTPGVALTAFFDNSPAEADAAWQNIITPLNPETPPLINSLNHVQQTLQEAWHKIQTTTLGQWINSICGPTNSESLFGGDTWD